MANKPKGWGRGCRRLVEKHHLRHGSSGSSTLNTLPVPGKVKNAAGREVLPYTARLKEDNLEIMWVKNKKKMRQRQVIGDQVQQPSGPPVKPEVLVLTNQMLDHTQ